ncbi:MAG: hypothetical protein DCC73_11480 [Proteobacteria bacterium]|nr:MAG: hypothetical protein DCC73_11480 [Pseudomonadota bacterium]
MAEETGVAKILAEAVDRLPLAPAAQLALIEDPTLRPAERLAEVKRRGRPPGAINRKTKDFAAYLLGRYPSPLIGLAEVAARSVADLAAELDCTKLEAFDRQLKALVELAPYLHGKMPVEVNLNSRQGVILAIPGLNMAAGQSFDEAVAALQVEYKKDEENQGLEK